MSKVADILCVFISVRRKVYFSTHSDSRCKEMNSFEKHLVYGCGKIDWCACCENDVICSRTFKYLSLPRVVSGELLGKCVQQTAKGILHMDLGDTVAVLPETTRFVPVCTGMTPYNAVGRWQCVLRTCCLHLQGRGVHRYIN